MHIHTHTHACLQMISVSCLDLSYSVKPTEGKTFKDETEDETDFVTLYIHLTSEEQLLLPQVTTTVTMS